MSLRVADDGELLAKTPVLLAGNYGDEALTRAAIGGRLVSLEARVVRATGDAVAVAFLHPARS